MPTGLSTQLETWAVEEAWGLFPQKVTGKGRLQKAIAGPEGFLPAAARAAPKKSGLRPTST